jgi:hypothetical protein
VSVQVPPSTNKEANLAPWGLGANFVEFLAGSSKGTLTLSFGGTGGAEWRVLVALMPVGGRGSPTVIPMTLTSGAGTLDVSGFGTRWSKAVLMPTIADVAGSAVPYSYGAAVQ